MLFIQLLFLFCLFISTPASETAPQIIAEISASGYSSGYNDPNPASLGYCNSWRLAVETNNAGHWKKVPSQCDDIIKQYIGGEQYVSDSKIVAHHAQAYAKTIEISRKGEDAWIFDVDETLLSNLQHYIANRYGSKASNETAFDQLINFTNAPALPWSLLLYKKLQGMGFQLILLTGRKENHRNSTEHNLLSVGYHSWKKLILRGTSDVGKTALAYKSEKRPSLEAKGYVIHGSFGDQWSDLLGSPMAKRSFKLPNPMYNII